MSGQQVDPREIDRLVHEPVRMALLSVLDGVEDADFVFLQRALGLTQGNLSTHLSRLQGAGLVEVVKSFHDRTPRTTVAITGTGRVARERHWRQLEALRALSTPAARPADGARARRPLSRAPGVAPA